MPQPFRRRTLIATAGALGALGTLPFPRSSIAQASRERVVVRVDQDIQNMDPAFRIGVEEGNIIRTVCQRLVEFKPSILEWELDAAEEITQESDTVISFKLKPGLMFQGGYGELTAEDVKFSYERFNNPPEGQEVSSYAGDWAALETVEVTGTHSGRLILKSPAPALWLVTLPDVSGAIVSKRAFEELGDKVKTQIHGTGAYAFTEWVPNQHILLTANPDYKGTAPHFREILIVPVTEPQTAELAFQRDEINFTKLENLASADTFGTDPNTTVLKHDSINYVWLGLNVTKPPFDNIAIRQAIRHGIDVEQVLLGAYDGRVSRAKTLQAPTVPGHWADAPVYQRDLERARALLAEGGMPDGFPTRLSVLNQPNYKAAGEIIQAQLAEIGIAVELEVLDPGAYWSIADSPRAAELEMSIQRFGGKFDPSFQTQWFTTQQIGTWNWQSWSNEEYDQLEIDAAATVDPKNRADKYIRMQQLMDESAAYVWLTHEVNIFVAKNWLAPAVLPNGDDWQYRHFSEA